jgi:aerobic carbon-monoxide dehydrogenase medium subunit
VIPAQVDYVRPADIGEALRILQDREGEAKVLAGGYSLIPLLKLRLAQPGILVDIAKLGLEGVTEDDDWLRIGARTTHRAFHEHPIVVDHYPMLRDVSGGIGDPQVRNWGTIGGSVAHADPAADWPAVLLATHARVAVRGTDGEREIPAREFFLDTFTTAIAPTEILTEVRIPRRRPRVGGGFTKLERKAGDFATVAACATLMLGEDGSIARSGIALTAVAETPFAATDAEAALAGQRPSEEAFRAAGAAAAAQSRPAADIRGPVEYKRAMAAEMVVRALRAATQRALSFG